MPFPSKAKQQGKVFPELIDLNLFTPRSVFIDYFIPLFCSCWREDNERS